ncbi:hypothetical protein F4801DRAFT_552611 [Xylaria longipes]|nr:hypothetical protein F4801DRAFT_552611 [Xylaria longipes]
MIHMSLLLSMLFSSLLPSEHDFSTRTYSKANISTRLCVIPSRYKSLNSRLNSDHVKSGAGTLLFRIAMPSTYATRQLVAAAIEHVTLRWVSPIMPEAMATQT